MTKQRRASSFREDSSHRTASRLFIVGVPLVGVTFVLTALYLFSHHHSSYLYHLLELESLTIQPATDLSSTIQPRHNIQSSTWQQELHSLNPLAIPPGEAQNLPSIRVEESHVETKRSTSTKYGGKGDKQHLGGFTQFDPDGVAPHTWKNMMQIYGVHSLMDVGCGRGTSTSWFQYQGVDVLCVEGSHDAVQQTLLPDPATQVVEHDYSRGPYWPAKTYDAVWSVEFLEHVGRNFHYNYITTFRKAALIFVTSSRWGGWHHVEVHPDDWWIPKFESYGFRYSKEMSDQMRQWASDEARMGLIGPHGHPYRPQHVWTSMKVFVNPVVASLPQHAHLFPQDGCFLSWKAGRPTGRKCDPSKMETVLPDSFEPIPFKPEKQKEWEQMIRNELGLKGNETWNV